jgi:hypothetical protein
MKLNLEGGVHLGNEESSLPGYIGCYGALYNENNILKCTKFFVRGCNRDGRFLTADNDQIFVLSARQSDLTSRPSRNREETEGSNQEWIKDLRRQPNKKTAHHSKAN